MPVQDWTQVTFENGLNQVQRASVLEDGEAASLQNFEFLPNGGLTPRPGWRVTGNNPTGVPTGNGRGLFSSWYQAGTRVIVATELSGGNFVTHRTNNAVLLTSGFTSWTQIDSAAVSASYQSLPLSYAVGNSVLLMTNPGFASGQMRAYDGATTSAVATSNIAGRALIYHLNRFWTGGAISEPTWLRFSEIGDHTNWNTDENYIPVSQDDGEPIEDIVVWDRGLVIGKKHSLHFLSGNLVTNFALSPLSTQIGCAPGRSLLATDLGVFIAGSDGNLYLWDGAQIQNLSGSYVAMTHSETYPVSMAFVDGKVWLVNSNNSNQVYCLDKGRWRYEVWQGEGLFIGSIDQYLVGLKGSSGPRFMSCRDEQGPFNTSPGSKRDPGGDTGQSCSFVARSKDFWPKGPLGKATMRSVYIKYHQWRATADKLTIYPVVDGQLQVAMGKTVGGKAAVGTYAERVDFHAGESATLQGTNFALDIEENGIADTAATYSIDEVWVQSINDTGRR